MKIYKRKGFKERKQMQLNSSARLMKVKLYKSKKWNRCFWKSNSKCKVRTFAFLEIVCFLDSTKKTNLIDRQLSDVMKRVSNLDA